MVEIEPALYAIGFGGKGRGRKGLWSAYSKQLIYEKQFITSSLEDWATVGSSARWWFAPKRGVAGKVTTRAGNEPNQLDNSLGLDSTINSLNLVHEPNELNLN
ncbi:hypothetical protein MTR_7g005700 [Medicago truncatula]|uniref:Uncharacterized protein n=1 Tax=Medicago truncatula TaxID=3880 RepID=G7KWM2_MEDTR|nr:hypothetical protein MTR_7g005700 [Medicago truncatula]